MTAGPLTPLLAHQGGWDEMLMVAGPIAVLWWILHRANLRSRRRAAGQDDQGQPAERSTGGDPHD